MVYFFIQHRVHRIPGGKWIYVFDLHDVIFNFCICMNSCLLLAYTHYAFFEWGLIFTDILYDSVSKFDFACAKIEVCGESMKEENNMVLTS